MTVPRSPAPRRPAAGPPAGHLAGPDPAATLCAGCSSPRPAGARCASPGCGRADRGWSVAWAVGAYEGALRRALVDYKYRGVVGWAPVLGRLVATWLEGNATAVEELDVLVPVPAYAGPGARRRFDAVGRIAAEAAAATGGAWAVAPGALVKTAETPPLARRAAPGRRVAAEGALRASLSVADAGAVAGARVLVVDDVMSTGSTLREVARVLRAAGADEVAALVVARAGLLAPFTSARAPGP